MTYPAYRHLLAARHTVRRPEADDRREIESIVVGAFIAGEPAGLAVGLLPHDRTMFPELLSVCVASDHRRQGLGTALVAEVEQAVEAAGWPGLGAVYTTGRPEIVYLERILSARGWSPPEARTLLVRFQPATALASPLWERERLAGLAEGLEIVPWEEIRAEEIAEARRSNEAALWIVPTLEPWHATRVPPDPSSVAARWQGRLVGWVINHRSAPDVVAFTCSYLRKDLSRRARILPLYRVSLERLQGGCRLATFVTPLVHPGMLKFIRRWIEPIAEAVLETRGRTKRFREPEWS